jgi:hypothetical protein
MSNVNPITTVATTELAAMKNKLRDIEVESDNVLQQAHRSCELVAGYIERLKELVISHDFDSEEEEIDFFKNIRPAFVSEHIYFRELYKTEDLLPINDRPVQIAYYQRILGGIQLFFERHKVLYNYYRTASTKHDRLYFLRSSQISMDTDYALDLDNVITAPDSWRLSKILAYVRLKDYLSNWINVLTTVIPANVSLSSRFADHAVNWTDSKVSLIELGYAIHSKCSVNNGKADIKDIMETLEQAFHIDLGNYYAVFQQNIRLRKKNRTVYLDQLRDTLTNRMDDDDMHPNSSTR